MNDTEKRFISHLAEYLPDRRPGKRGTKPISKYLLLVELFKLAKTNCGWRNIEYSSTCRNYLYEIQRRSKLKNFLNFLLKDYNKFKLPRTIIDSSDIVSYRTNGLITYSGKYHNYCAKVSVEITPDFIPVSYSLDKGSEQDSTIFDKMLIVKDKLPYVILLDKGYERYARRRELKKKNCQLRIEMKKNDKNRKRGPRFKFTHQHKRQRGEIEKFVSWFKCFMIFRLSRLRRKSLLHAMVLIALYFLAFRKLKL